MTPQALLIPLFGQFLIQKKVKTESGKDIDVASDSVCVYGDTPGAVRLAEAIARNLGENDIEIRPLGRAQQRIS